MKKNVKVCHITSVHPCRDNRIFYKECRSLAEYGYEVILLALAANPFSENGVEVCQLSSSKNRLFRIIFVSFFEVLRKAFEVKADLYHFHDPEILPAGFVLRLLGKKVVYDAHENLGAALKSKPYLPKIVRHPLSWCIFCIEHFLSYFLTGVVCATEDIAASFSRDVCLLRNFPAFKNMNFERTTSVEKKKFTAIYVGGMSEIRGIRELVDSFANLNDCELWLLGPFKSKALEDYCYKSSGWKNTKYFGQVLPDEIFGYISKADIGIVTFYPEPNHVTALPNKPFEYMACGLPLVMSDFSYWKKFWKESAIYVNPKSTSEIAGAINLWKESFEQRKKIGLLNKEKVVNEYNWEKEFDSLVQYYSQII